ncbi:hypothetical protein BH10ACI2_BH10ACI2_02910 [soil metagenome]
MSENGHKHLCFEFANFRLYPHERLLTKNADRVPLTPRVMDLLIVLVEHQGELVSKEALLEAVWAGSFVEEGNINRTISTLRKNLGSQSNGGDLIETVPKLGYRFIAPVKEISDEDINEPATLKRKRFGWPIWLVGCASIALLGIVIYYFVSSGGPVRRDGMVRLTNNLAEDDSPEFSPDGKRIAFVSNRDGARNIYVMNSNGGNVVRLTNVPAAENSPTWSPDGTKILFESSRDGNPEIYVMGSDGANQRRLTFNPTTDGGPACFSPDGNRIVFARSAANEGDAYYNFDIYTMNADGGDLQRLTTDPEYDAGPHWSPDGSKILFVSGREKNFDVFVMNADGSDQKNLTHDHENEVPIAWTPDGQQIIYNADSASKRELYDIWVMNSDGSNRRQISSFSEKTYNVFFSPAAKTFVFSTKKDGNFEIYTMDAANLLNN